jgi:hypothetical protein
VGALVWLAGCAARRPTHATAVACIERADAGRRSCFQECEGEFENGFIACYGRSACTERCETEQLVCQAGPLNAMASCGEAAESEASCRSRLHADLQACPAGADRAACERDARRRAAACWAGCRRANGPALERCTEAFTGCLDGCLVP